MNIKPLNITNTYREIPPEFQQILRQKSANFVGREFVFTAINKFINQYDRGYFTIVGVPGSGKSAILAKYKIDNPNVIYYNAQLENKNSPKQFIKSICAQIIETCDTIYLHTILQEISNQLKPDEKFIIIVDALDTVVRNNENLISNIFYLPRYLPKGIYFLLSRRPYITEKSGLLIETHSEILDLANYPQENQKDIQIYIQQYLSQFDSDAENHNHQPENTQELIQQLTFKSEHNFMFISYILGCIFQNLSSENFSLHNALKVRYLPRDLEAYYQRNLQQMFPETGLLPFLENPENTENSITRTILSVLAEQSSAISASAITEYLNHKLSDVKDLTNIPETNIAKVIDIEEYDVEEVLEKWIEFFRTQWIEEKNCYILYHSHFRKWLYQQIHLTTNYLES